MKLHHPFARRSLSLLFSMIFALSLCACGGKTASLASEQAEWSAMSSVSAVSAEPEAEESAPAASSALVESAPGAPDEAPDPLSLWTDGSASKEALLEYVDAVTREDSTDFIPGQERVAVFDVDGTLFCETDPIYFDWEMYTYRVLDDPDYADEATEEQIDMARRIRAAGGSTSSIKGDERTRLNAEVYSGLTPKDYQAFVRSYLEQDAPGYTGMKRGEAFYRPMVELVSFLQEKGFTVYLCSATDRFAVRALACDALDLPPRQVIGTDVTLVARGQGDERGVDYDYDEDDAIVRGTEVLRRNRKMNKVTALMREVGAQPVLAFGNSSGDEGMAAFACSGNPHRSMACFVCCDDTQRERGDPEQAEATRTLCAAHGWVPISMRDDWTTIYGPGVTKK